MTTTPQRATGSPGRPTPYIPIVLLSAISIFGLNALTGQLSRSGYLSFINSLLADPASRLPGSEALLLKRYTGVAALDHAFAVGNVIFASVTDGSRPELSLLAFCFGGQLVAFLSVVMVESQRVARGSGIIFNPIVWGLIMQAVGFGVVAPVFFVVHLIYSSRLPLLETVHLRDPTKLQVVGPAFTFGYFLLTCFLVYPFSLSQVHQWSNAIWQVFPLHVVAWQLLFSSVIKRLSIGARLDVPKTQIDRSALNHAYGFAWNVAVTTQLCTYAVLLASWIVPGLFPAGVARALTVDKVFIPGSPYSHAPMASAAAAMHEFFKYDLYTGFAGALVWGVHLLSQVRPVLASSRAKREFAKGIIQSVFFAGPGGALVAIMQHRDETALTEEAKAEKSQ
ncbi:hypothetical protein G7046_g2333 [Stylonectria norvegica]|nr:hypothetical protein G7046_g2333 [Stylonectria norvegica]